MDQELRPSWPERAICLQFTVRPGDPEANLATVRARLDQAEVSGPALVLLPELWATGFAYPQLPELAVRTPELLASLAQEAAARGIFLAGSLPEAVFSEIDTVIYNTFYLVGPAGVIGQYRKQQLFAPLGEAAHFAAGDDPQPLSAPWGPTAALVCYDLRFPELAREQAGQGADLLLVAAQWPLARREQWRTLLRARAIENQLFVVACNSCGRVGDSDFAGGSAVIAPDGTILAEAGPNEEIISAPLEPSRLAAARRLFRSAGLRPYRHHDQDKIVELAAVLDLAAGHRAAGRRLVFTNGCFDLLHAGHVSYLEAARKLGDVLIVGLNSDASVRSLGKGADRPVNSEQARARVLAGLGCVDLVVIFSESTPQRLISALLPEVLVKGGDWPVTEIVGGAEVLAAGGRVLSLPLVGDCSTTATLARIRKS